MDEEAITTVDGGNPDLERWRAYCFTIAGRILGNPWDAEECVNEVMFRAPEAISRYKPSDVKTFLGKLTRNTAINQRKKLTAQKRDIGKCVPLEELSELVSGSDDPEGALLKKELAAAINEFLGTLSKRKRELFVLRYWHFESVKSLAHKFGISEKTVYVQLHRIREKLEKYLKEREFLL